MKKTLAENMFVERVKDSFDKPERLGRLTEFVDSIDRIYLLYDWEDNGESLLSYVPKDKRYEGVYGLRYTDYTRCNRITIFTPQSSRELSKVVNWLGKELDEEAMKVAFERIRLDWSENTRRREASWIAKWERFYDLFRKSTKHFELGVCAGDVIPASQNPFGNTSIQMYDYYAKVYTPSNEDFDKLQGSKYSQDGEIIKTLFERLCCAERLNNLKGGVKE